MKMFQIGDFTLRHGDWVKFVIAVDRRDKLRRATRIELMDQSFSVSDERREQVISFPSNFDRFELLYPFIEKF